MNIRALPLFVYILLVTTLLMFVPAVFALAIGDMAAVDSFFVSATVLLTITITVAIAVINRKPKPSGRLHLITLLCAYLFVPLLAAIPFWNEAPQTSLSQAYFEMMSSFTTTGATLYADPSQISDALHLWRALMGWFGGLVILIAAIAVMEPLNLGGFEIRANNALAKSDGKDRRARAISPSDRVVRATRKITPYYLGATGALALILMILGDPGFVAVCHAMAILSTSGISPIGGLAVAPSGFWGEAAIVIFLGAALSHRLLIRDFERPGIANLDATEFRVAVVVIAAVSSLLFLFHFVGIASEDTKFTLWRAFHAWWGGFFTTISYLTTTGFVSADWALAKAWGNLNNVGLILLCLAICGGGIATTAGGIKLLRVYVLTKHGQRELDRLVHPSSVAGFGADARHIRREGAYVTWMFVMLFVLSIAGISLALALCGEDFETALVLAIASLSNTGPLASAFGQEIGDYRGLSDNARMYLDISMIIGRMEILAVVAILNSAQWRR